MPWAHEDHWDQHRLAHTRALFVTRAGSAALQRGGLRWLHVADDALTFLREAPGESVLVHAARASHAPVRIPEAVLGARLTGLAGAADLHADAGGRVTLPANGPAFGMWRLDAV
jgi:alpha-glucosidase